jgi:hypothetical protein
MWVVTLVLLAAVVGGSFLFGDRSGQAQTAVFGVAPALHEVLRSSLEPSLKRLADYEQHIGRGVDNAMLFQDMPKTTQVARSQAADFADVLKEYAHAGVSPLVVLEPQEIDLNQVSMDALKVYFDTLKAEGVTDESIGTWIPFPEPNIPEWHNANTDPKIFVSNVTACAQLLRDRFPKVHVAVLLDSKTYPSGDTYWANGTYSQKELLKYASGFPKGLIDIAGLQGLMWEPPANDEGEKVYDAATFLPAKSAIALAKKLEVQQVLLNTGTYASMHDYVEGGRVTATDDQRKQTLTTILDQATLVQQAGLLTTITLFAEDKRQTEADWSYGQSPASWAALKGFVDTASQKGLALSFFVGSE